MIRFARRSLFLTLIVLVILSRVSAVRADSIYTNDQVRLLVVFGKIRGHVLASIADWDSGAFDLAAQHIDQINAELSSIIATNLQQANLDQTYQASLSAYAQLVGQAGDKDKVHAAYNALVAVVDQAGKAFAPAAAFDSPAFRLSVGQGLLDGVLEEYGEGVDTGKLVEPIGYQNAVGFYQVVKEHYSAIQSTLQAQYPTLVTTLTSQYAVLDAALPSFTAPATLVDSATLEAVVQAIKTVVSSTLNIDLDVQRSPAEVIAASRTGLLDALDYLGKGQADPAYEAAASAYLDNYETLEVPLRKKNADLANLIEQQMVDFGKMIKAGQSLDDLKALYAKIDPNLAQAQVLLTQL